MKKFLKSEVCRSHEQYTGPTCVIEKWLKSQIVWLKKKKKKKTENANAQRGRAAKHTLRANYNLPIRDLTEI